jgi:catechol 2,3-dioxygenase-like lactoylglutathione lyase family enzyme
MLKHFDHVTVAVADPAAAIGFGFNHICFAVPGIDGLIARVTAAGVRLRNRPMAFHDRKLVFLEGREGMTVELAEWK